MYQSEGKVLYVFRLGKGLIGKTCMQETCCLAPFKRDRRVAKAMIVRRHRRGIGAALLVWSICQSGQDAGAAVPDPMGLIRAIAMAIPKAADWAEKYREVPDFPLQKVSEMPPERSVQKHAQKLVKRLLWGN